MSMTIAEKLESLRSSRDCVLASKRGLCVSMLPGGEVYENLAVTSRLLVGQGSTLDSSSCGVYDVYIYLMMQRALLSGTGGFRVCPSGEVLVSTYGTNVHTSVTSALASWRERLLKLPAVTTLPFTAPDSILTTACSGGSGQSAPYDFYIGDEEKFNTSSSVCVNNSSNNVTTLLFTSSTYWTSLKTKMSSFYTLGTTTTTSGATATTYTRKNVTGADIASLISYLQSYKNSAEVVLEVAMSSYYTSTLRSLLSTSTDHRFSAPSRTGTSQISSAIDTIVAGLRSLYTSTSSVVASSAWASFVDGGDGNFVSGGTTPPAYDRGSIYVDTISALTTERNLIDSLLDLGRVQSNLGYGYRGRFIALLNMIMNRTDSPLSTMFSYNRVLSSMDSKIADYDSLVSMIGSSDGSDWLSTPTIFSEYYDEDGSLNIVYDSLPCYTSLSVWYHRVTSDLDLYRVLTSPESVDWTQLYSKITPRKIERGRLSSADGYVLMNSLPVQDTRFLLRMKLYSSISDLLDRVNASESSYSTGLDSALELVSVSKTNSELRIETEDSVTVGEYVLVSDGTGSSSLASVEEKVGARAYRLLYRAGTMYSSMNLDSIQIRPVTGYYHED